MKKFTCVGVLLLILTLASCAGVTEGQGTASGRRDANYNWGSDAACSPGCPPGMSGSW